MATHVREFDSAVAVPSSRGSVLDRVTSTGARVAFALPFAVFGVFHLTNAGAMSKMVPLPGAVFLVYLTGLALIAGSVGVLTKTLGKWAALGLAALLASFIAFIHLPGLGNPQMGQMAMTNLLKDTALLGGALAWAGILGRTR